MMDMSSTQTVTLNHITRGDVNNVTGSDSCDTTPVTVTCPADYDPAQITAADVVYDDQIVVVAK